MDELKYTIAETSERLDLSYRTLHYYEQKIGLSICRDGSGNRIYSENDIEMLENIVELKKKGMTLDGIKTLFQEKGIVPPDDNKNIVVVDEKVLQSKEAFIAEIREAVSIQMKAEIAENNAKLENLVNQVVEENSSLKERIEELLKKNEEHYDRLDQQLTAWRETKSMQQPWYKKIFKK